jgi:TPR repeat protein
VKTFRTIAVAAALCARLSAQQAAVTTQGATGRAQAAPAGYSQLDAAGLSAGDLYAIGRVLKNVTPATPELSDLAAKVLKTAAGLGHGGAWAQLGEMYLGGRVPLESGQDRVQEAIRCWNTAWENGSTTGYLDLGLLYYNIAIPGTSVGVRNSAVRLVEQDYGKAFQCFTAACAKRDPKSYRWVGASYENGTGVAQDFEKAAQYYELGIEYRDATSHYLLANLLLADRGVPRDVARAMALYQSQIDRGRGLDAGACAYSMAQMYEKGEHVAADKTKAIEYCRIAVDNGYAEARRALERHAAELFAEGKGLLKAGRFEAALPLVVMAPISATPLR